VRRPVEQFLGDRLAPELRDVDPVGRQHAHGIGARRLSGGGAETGGFDGNPLNPSIILRKSPSAIGLRQMLPVQTKRTCRRGEFMKRIL